MLADAEWAPEGEEPGAEPSTVTVYRGVSDYDSLKYAMAVRGRMGEQLAVIPFVADDHGPDSLWALDFPATMDVVRATLDRCGIPFRTLSQTDVGVRVYLFDQGTQMEGAVKAAVDAHGARTRRWRGRGELFPPEAESREAACRDYESFIDEYERRHPERPRWQGLGLVDRGNERQGGDHGVRDRYRYASRRRLIAGGPIERSHARTAQEIDPWRHRPPQLEEVSRPVHYGASPPTPAGTRRPVTKESLLPHEVDRCYARAGETGRTFKEAMVELYGYRGTT